MGDEGALELALGAGLGLDVNGIVDALFGRGEARLVHDSENNKHPGTATAR